MIYHNVLEAFILLENGTVERPTLGVDPVGFFQHEGNFRIITPTKSLLMKGQREAELSMYNKYLEVR